MTTQITQTPLDFLTQRQSNGFLEAPAPSDSELTKMLEAAIATPDHGHLKPYRFDVIQGKGLDTLTDIFVKAMTLISDDPIKQQKAKTMAYRAPMIIVVSTQYQQHPKVPKHEQMITAGCATYALQMAAVAQGYNALWRTGALAEHPLVKQQLHIDEQQDIVGFLYVGSESKALAAKPRRLQSVDVRHWR
ncbi:nitroreductase family protein [Thalassotalea ponticola]|uniref:nitroreductase family protein n=1 Tax=Thalassotalea ponticola TaxID=1523392 RepID=UPI0025B5F5DF|nr:nitroreductase family protein [Thalassotalea ponticola]MDN3651482.1 nitroreductase family protein [Thalassotalea ponticola]